MQLEIAHRTIQQEGPLQPRIIRLCIHTLRIKAERLPVPLSFEKDVTLFLEVLPDLFIFLAGFRVSAACAVQ